MKSLRKKGMAVVLSTLLIMNYSIPVFAADANVAAGNATATVTTTTTVPSKVAASDSTSVSAKTFAITTSATHGTVTESTNVESGKDHTITYTAEKGYALAVLLIDGKRISVKDYPKSYTFKNVTAAHSVKVVFMKEGEINIDLPTYTIESKVTNGTIDKTSDVSAGGEITIHYAPNDGYVLKKLVIDGESVDESNFRNSYTFSAVAKNHTIEVEFEQEDNTKANTYTIRTSAENGTITETDSNVAEGASKTVKYAPNSGYSLKEVLVDGVKVDLTAYPSSYTFSDVTKDHSVVVTYASEATPSGGNTNNNAPATKTYTITTTATNGTITQTKTVNSGSNVTITYSPNSGYRLSRVTIDGNSVDTSKYGSSYTFSNVTENHSVRVVYRKAPTTASSTSNNSSNKTTASSAKTRSASKNSTSTGSDAATGDNSNAEGYALLAAAAGLTCGGLLLTRRKRQ